MREKAKLKRLGPGRGSVHKGKIRPLSMTEADHQLLIRLADAVVVDGARLFSERAIVELQERGVTKASVVAALVIDMSERMGVK